MKAAITSIALACAVSTFTALAQDQETAKPAAPAPAQGGSGAKADAAPVAETGGVTGKVIDGNQKPVKGASVALVVPVEPQTNAVAAGAAPAKRPLVIAHVSSGDDGTFKLENIPVGKYVVSVHGDKSLRPGHTKDLIEVKAKETVDAGTVTLPLRAAADATPAKPK